MTFKKPTLNNEGSNCVKGHLVNALIQSSIKLQQQNIFPNYKCYKEHVTSNCSILRTDSWIVESSTVVFNFLFLWYYCLLRARESNRGSCSHMACVSTLVTATPKDMMTFLLGWLETLPSLLERESHFGFSWKGGMRFKKLRNDSQIITAGSRHTRGQW